MSGHQAIAAVTAAMQTLLLRAVSDDKTVTGGQVTVHAPDRARTDNTGNQINLFLYRTAIDAAWRNQPPISLRPGESGEPALALSLSYLITAYGADDDEILSHRLLGIAMSVLNDQPILSRSVLSTMTGSGVENQPERIRIVPHPIPMDEISRMWATFQTGYRISVSYDVSPVLIDSNRAPAAPAPVLGRGQGDTGPFVGASVPPQLVAVTPPPGRGSVIAGDTLTLTGQGLDRVTGARIASARLAAAVDVAVTAINPTTAELTVPGAGLPAGPLTVAVISTDAYGTTVIGTPVPFGLAPTIVDASPLVASLVPDQPANPATATATVTLQCAPATVAGQNVAIVLRDRLVAGTADAAHPDRLTFVVTDAEAGSYPLRLRIDGQDNPPLLTDGTPAFYRLDIT